MNMWQILYGVMLTSLSSLTFATVGGAESIQIMGYDQKAQKLYLTRQYHDQSGRVPQLYYYQLNNQQPDKLIEVKSIYKNIDRHSPRAEQHVSKELKKIQSRLIPLHQQNRQKLHLNVIKTKTSTGDYWQTSHPDDAFQVKKYQQQFLLCQQNYGSTIQSSISYLQPKLNITQYWQVPQQPVRVAVVSYLGMNVESGYTKEDPVLLLAQSTKTSCKSNP